MGQSQTFTSDWYTTSGHSQFCADKNYGFSRYPLLKNIKGSIDHFPSIAHRGTQTDVEFKVAGNQIAFKYAVPSILKSRVNDDDLVLSGRMDHYEQWTPRIEASSLGHWEARWAGWPSDKWPVYCGYSDSTGFPMVDYSADPFAWMLNNGGFHGPSNWGTDKEGGKKEWHHEWVRFIDEDYQKSYCQDISGTFILKAPELKGGMGGIMLTHQKSGKNTPNFIYSIFRHIT